MANLSSLISQDQFFITVGTEAFLVALYQNCYAKWQHIAEENKAGRKNPDRKHEKMRTAFIDSDAGQARWGGWNKTGREYFKEVAGKIQSGRAEDHVQEMEKACLARLRDKYEIEERDKKRGSKAGKKRKIEEEEEEEDDEFDSF